MNARSKVGVAVLATACLLGLALASYADDEKTAQAQPTLAEAQRAAPNFVGISNWLNSGPLNIATCAAKSSSSISGPLAALTARAPCLMSRDCMTNTKTRG